MSDLRAEDERAIVAIVETFFAAFTSGPEVAERLAGLRELFLPEAVIVKTCGGEPTTYDVDGFVAPRLELLTNGTLTDFREWPMDGRTEVFGDVAQHWCGYAKEGVQEGVRVAGKGRKSIQLVRTGEGWRISAAAWDDERSA